MYAKLYQIKYNNSDPFGGITQKIMMFYTKAMQLNPWLVIPYECAAELASTKTRININTHQHKHTSKSTYQKKLKKGTDQKTHLKKHSTKHASWLKIYLNSTL